MKITTSITSQAAKLLATLSVVALATLASPAHAAKFGVRVVDESGSPISGASVCVGLQGNYKQFGTAFTDASGQVMVEVPNVPLLVTVSKDRFTGTRTTEPARSFNLVKQVKLRTGLPGPRCRAGSYMAESTPNAPKIRVSGIDISTGENSTTLAPVVTGEPSQYRVSTSKDFDGAVWKKFSTQIALGASMSDAEKVYVQLRKREGTSKAYFETRSDVLTVRLAN